MVTLDLQNLLVCRNILKDKLVQELAEAVASPDDLSASHRFAGHLMEKAEQEGKTSELSPKDMYVPGTAYRVTSQGYRAW